MGLNIKRLSITWRKIDTKEFRSDVKMKYIKKNAWVTVNIDFFCHEWGNSALFFTSDEVKSQNHCGIASWVTKIVIHDNECINLFLTHYFMSWTHNSAKNNYRSLISPLWLWLAFSDLALWRHHSRYVTSRERGVLTLWRHIRRLFLRTQIRAKAIFTSE